MPLKNTPDRYGAVHKTLHWTIALLVLMMLVMGFVMGDIPRGPDKFWVYGIHKSIGITILFLMLARFAWKLMNWHRPKPLPTHKPWERTLAGAVHWGFYVLLIAMPLSGWLGTGAANSTINWFGFFTVPNITGPDQDMREFFFEAHEIIAWGIIAFIGLHVAGVAKHLVIDRDETLSRMWPFAAFMLVMLVPSPARADDNPAVWTIDRERSVLGFSATQEGGAFDGAFGAFDGEIIFEPDDLANSAAKITIDLNSFQSGNDERDKSVKEKDWFDLGSNPTATYTIDSFEKDASAPNAYTGRGRLFLRGIERPLDLPFTLVISDGKRVRTAHAVGKTTLQRLAFDVGGGEWADPAMVGDDVVVTIDLYATAKDE